MRIAKTRLTAQGQVSIPAKVRRLLGVGPGSVLEWSEEGKAVVVRRGGETTFAEIHKALFPEGQPKARTLKELKAGLLTHGKARHARR
jgi:antitoxin PrlF